MRDECMVTLDVILGAIVVSEHPYVINSLKCHSRATDCIVSRAHLPIRVGVSLYVRYRDRLLMSRTSSTTIASVWITSVYNVTRYVYQRAEYVCIDHQTSNLAASASTSNTKTSQPSSKLSSNLGERKKELCGLSVPISLVSLWNDLLITGVSRAFG